MTDDRDVIRRSIGEPSAFEEIFDRHWAEVIRYARQRTGHDAGEEIAARTFLVAFEQRERFDRSYASAKPWLLGIATNLIRRHRRQERRQLTAMSKLPAVASTTPVDDPARLHAQIHSARLLNALASLDRRYRDAFLLLALGDLSYPEIAQALGVSEGTVASRISRARKKLREAIPVERAIDDVIGE